MTPPLTPAASRPLPTSGRAYSARAAALMAAMCQIAYLAPSDMETELRAGGFELLGASGRFMLVGCRDEAILAWRGTVNEADWRLDFSAVPVPLPRVPGVKVHSGFLSAFEADWPAADALVQRLPSAVDLYITGHSLGGAIAQIATATYDRESVAACYTFGSPRVGSRDFDRQVRSPHYRIVNAWDVVPGVPEPWLSGYRHTGDPRLLTGDGKAAYRRDRSLAGRLLADLAGIAGAAITRRLPCVDDHMIWNYRARLGEIVAARAT